MKEGVDYELEKTVSEDGTEHVKVIHKDKKSKKSDK